MKSLRQQAIEHASDMIEHFEGELQRAKDAGYTDNEYWLKSIEIEVKRYEALTKETVQVYKARITAERDDLQAFIDEPFTPTMAGRHRRNEIDSYTDAVCDAQLRINDINLELEIV